MKGLLLAGGHGSRLYPSTISISKQLLPVYDKPMVYYPISTLLQAGIRDILIITSEHERHLYEKLLKDGSQWGIRLTYATQDYPRGIADAFIVGEKFIGEDSVCLILGDNIIYGDKIGHLFQTAKNNLNGATIFGYYVKDPERYGVVDFDEQGQVVNLIEKPQHPPSHYAVIGIYFYDHHVVDIAKQLKPSARGELEITDVSLHYLQKQKLNVELLGRGVAWLDTGTQESLLQAAHFIQVLEQRQALKIGCPEEIAWRMGLIDDHQLKMAAEPLLKSDYGQYLLHLLNE